MEFDFDEIIDRRGSGAMKWDKYAGRDVIPMWVAEMDFRAPPAVIAALEQRVRHGVFGYTDPPAELNEAIVAYLDRTYGWRIEPDWLLWLPGLVSGLNLMCRAIGEDGDDVVTATPVYHPFLSAPLHQRRTLTQVPMQVQSERWTWNLEQLEESITARSKLLLLCNPHNPVGRVFDRDELIQLAQIAERHDLIVAADEIHCGLVLDEDKPHIPFATLGADIASRTITLMSASKIFNLPGLGCAFAIVSNPALRSRLLRAAAGIVPRVNLLGFVATLAAYRDSAGWHRALLAYLRGNRDLVLQHIRQIPGIGVAPIEATYLAWLDVRQCAPADPVAFFEDAGIGLYDGRVFGTPGYVRMNFGCPRPLLVEALRRFAAVLADAADPSKRART